MIVITKFHSFLRYIPVKENSFLPSKKERTMSKISDRCLAIVNLLGILVVYVIIAASIAHYCCHDEYAAAREVDTVLRMCENQIEKSGNPALIEFRDNVADSHARLRYFVIDGGVFLNPYGALCAASEFHTVMAEGVNVLGSLEE